MTAETLLERALAALRTAAPAGMSPEDIDAFYARNRAALLRLADSTNPSIRGTRGAARLYWDGGNYCVECGYLTTRGFEVARPSRPYTTYEGAKKAAWTWAGRPPKLKDLKVDAPVMVLGFKGETVGRGRIVETSSSGIGVEWPVDGQSHRAWFHPWGKEIMGDRRIQP